jgi:hypothetical protein
VSVAKQSNTAVFSLGWVFLVLVFRFACMVFRCGDFRL